MPDTPDFMNETDAGMEVNLATTIDVDGAPTKTLTMREPTVQDQLDVDAMKGTPAVREVTLMANLCQVTPDQLKSMPMRNYKRLQVALEFFMEEERTT